MNDLPALWEQLYQDRVGPLGQVCALPGVRLDRQRGRRMIIPPAHLLLFWTAFGGLAFAMSIRIGTETARANIELVSTLSHGYSISYLGSFAVCGVQSYRRFAS